ncbi:MAG: DUF5615 family PIN-like protein [Sphingomonas sp.]|uniref:DUF5615 family PIN-like protein n=1 Tax=Sphingomonas sp. TaxID=28214 RepID=UPI002274907A|nr:DUF5615 family PIN-like protein [Sphingomonas sp.]MCX8476482.1 DUF5615 family PIN-like protein [Sphingomonas sp.]
MRFLLDENVPFDLFDALCERRHEVEHVARIAARADDIDILARAVADCAILLTFDSDFGRLIFYEQRAAPPGVVYLQSHSTGVAQTVAMFLRILDEGDLDISNQFIVIDQHGALRVLPLR